MSTASKIAVLPAATINPASKLGIEIEKMFRLREVLHNATELDDYKLMELEGELSTQTNSTFQDLSDHLKRIGVAPEPLPGHQWLVDNNDSRFYLVYQGIINGK